jgi:flagellar protein FlaG
LNPIEVTAQTHPAAQESQTVQKDKAADSQGVAPKADDKSAPTKRQDDIRQKVAKEIEDVNEKLQQDNHKVVFQYDDKIHRVWLNLVDKSTGKVIEEMPPEIIRKLAERLGDIKGLIIDKHS